jgi:hypothetical protein
MTQSPQPLRWLPSAFWHHLVMRMVQFTVAVVATLLVLECVNGPYSAQTKGRWRIAVALALGGTVGMVLWVGIGRLFRRLPVRCRECRRAAYVTADSWTKATYTCRGCGLVTAYNTPTPP